MKWLGLAGLVIAVLIGIGGVVLHDHNVDAYNSCVLSLQGPLTPGQYRPPRYPAPGGGAYLYRCAREWP